MARMSSTLNRAVHMGPLFAANDSADRPHGYAVFRREIAVGDAASRVRLANIQRRGLCQLGPCVTRATSAALLGNHVLHVGFSCAQEEMVRTHAIADVTGVADVNTFWDCPVMDLPREAMYRHAAAAARAPADCAIAIRLRTSCVNPTPVRLGDSRPKTVSNSSSHRSNHTPWARQFRPDGWNLFDAPVKA